MSLHYNKETHHLFVNGTKIIKFRSKDSKILQCPLCLGNISRVYDFSIDYDIIAIDDNDNLDIHKYSRKKNNVI